MTVDGKAYQVTVEPTTGEVKTVSPAPAAKPENVVEVKVKLQGIVSEIYVAVGYWRL